MNLTVDDEPEMVVKEIAEQRESGRPTTECQVHLPRVHACGRTDHGDVMLSCGCKLPVVASACSKSNGCQIHSRNKNTPTRFGTINGRKVECLRDSGCSTLVCKIDYVREEQFTGQKEACVLIDGVVKYYPTAAVELDTPFYQGKAKALCMENPLYDVIIRE